MARSFVNVNKMPAAAENIAHIWKKCMKVVISLPVKSKSTALQVMFENDVIWYIKRTLMRNLPKLLKSPRDHSHNPETSMLCNNDKNTKAGDTSFIVLWNNSQNTYNPAAK